jgi:outer membrane protein assembly factor BamA
MAILKKKCFRIFFSTYISAAALLSAAYCQQVPEGQYYLYIKLIDKDSSFAIQPLELKTVFPAQLQCMDYINNLPSLLISKGYAAASVDKITLDTASASVLLYLGQRQSWIRFVTEGIDQTALDESGFSVRDFINKPVDFVRLQNIRERMLHYYEKIGYPFAAIYLDSVQLEENGMNAILKLNYGPLYHIDSVSVKGKVKISNFFLQRYLGIPNGSIYNKEKLDQVSKRLAELPYVEEQQPAELMLLGTGSILNLYLQPKRSSQVNFLIGFLPANAQTNKLQLTGDINLNLKNALGNAETILLNWQQLQLKSPRLNIGYQQPYIFKSNVGFDFLFDLFKKDSTFLQINAQVGIQYLLSATQSGKLFFQNQKTFLLDSGVDTGQVKFTKKLPANIDVSAINIGLDYEWTKTNYRLNPRTGNEIRLIASAGLKTISKNNDILALADPSFNYASLYDSIKLRTYQLRAKIIAAHYFPAGRQGTLKASINAGIFQSAETFRNELFQIGGYKLLRGFDEESIFATQYGVFTAEYRYLLGRNSYMFAFTDIGLVKNKYQEVNLSNHFISTGLGILFETKAGLLNMSFAIGKRNDVNFDLRRAAKIHFGYINYF